MCLMHNIKLVYVALEKENINEKNPLELCNRERIPTRESNIN